MAYHIYGMEAYLRSRSLLRWADIEDAEYEEITETTETT